MSAAKLVSVRNVAAYLLDRADQYDTESPCWIALTDAARNIVRGEIAAAKANGDLDAALYARVDSMSRYAALAPAEPAAAAAPKEET